MRNEELLKIIVTDRVANVRPQQLLDKKT